MSQKLGSSIMVEQNDSRIFHLKVQPANKDISHNSFNPVQVKKKSCFDQYPKTNKNKAMVIPMVKIRNNR